MECKLGSTSIKRLVGIRRLDPDVRVVSLNESRRIAALNPGPGVTISSLSQPTQDYLREHNSVPWSALGDEDKKLFERNGDEGITL